MFTGIVQTTGVVQSVQSAAQASRLVLDAPGLQRPIAHGASICVSGVCLTVARSDKRFIEFDVVAETMQRSTLAAAAVGTKVNLEPSLKLTDGLDGHLVQGHVDGIVRMAALDRSRGSVMARFDADSELMTYIIPKGSIAIDGVSLTVAEVAEKQFSVAWIPTTLEITTLGQARIGQAFNVETDIISRTVITTLQRWQAADKDSGITMETLREQGFV